MDKSISPSTYKGQYRMHKYWAKKPFNIIREYIKEYTEKNDIILDPFCGSGVTISEAIKTGRKCIGNDLNPVATFITKNMIKPINISDFEDEFKKIKSDLKSKINNLYKFTCQCDNEVYASHTIWEENEPKQIRYQCESCGKVKKDLSSNEKEKIMNQQEIEPPYWVPKDELIVNSRINVKEGDKVSDLFTNRNLAALSMLWNRINNIEDEDIRESFKFVFTSSVHQASRLVFVINRNGKKQVGSWVAGYWTPDEFFEVNAWRNFKNGYEKVLRGKQKIVEEKKIKKLDQFENNEFSEHDDEIKFVETFEDLQSKSKKSCLLTQKDATDLSYIPNEKIDYIFTDPPYGDSHPYFEISMLWGSWLDLELDFEKEIVVSDSNERDKDINDYEKRLKKSLKEMSRVLKKGGLATIAFNNIGSKEWNIFLEAYKNAGFRFVDIHSIKDSAGSVKQDSRSNSLKGHFLITLKKAEPRNSLHSESEESVIANLARRILEKEGALDTHHLYNKLIIKLIEKDIKNETGFDLLEIFKRNFKKRDGKWNIEQ